MATSILNHEGDSFGAPRRYPKIRPRFGSMQVQAADKRGVLSSARRLLRATTALEQRMGSESLGEQAALWPSHELPALAPGARRRPVSRRRREISERSHCRCHCCSPQLTLDGMWHSEQMVPSTLALHAFEA